MPRARALAALLALAAACSSTRTPPPPPPPRAAPDAAPAPDVAAPDAVAEADGPTAPTGDAARLYREAVEAAGRNEFAEAARLFGEAYGLAPSLEMAFNTFRMHERTAAVADAERWHARVLSHDPPPALRADLGQRMAALRGFARRRREDIAQPPPGDDALVREAAGFFARGVALYRRRQFRAALDAFEAALRYSRESRREVAELYFNLAVTHERLGHRPEAVAAFREYLARRPDTPDRADVERRVRSLSE